jgi:hypothetical protein
MDCYVLLCIEIGMAVIRSFEDLEVWQAGKRLVVLA